MKLKLFGKSIFEYSKDKKSGGVLFEQSTHNLKKEKTLPDFHNGRGQSSDNFDYIMPFDPERLTATKAKAKKAKEKTGKQYTPKQVYEMKALNDDKFEINVGKKYLKKQIEDFKEKLDILGKTNYDMENGVREVSSILIRLENRKKYAQFKSFFDNYAYTTNTKINELLKNQEHLQLGSVSQFIADMPKEAVDEMKAYKKNTKELCGKEPVFYLIADKKDFKKTNSRKDPILLAQSPFGHVWQILGAWDDEMLFLEEL